MLRPTSCARCPGQRDRPDGLLDRTPRTGVHIDYLNVVRLGGITYLAQSPPGGRPIASGDLGPVVRPLRTRLADLNDPARLLRDGDAAYLPVGTKLHQLKGYLPRFRLSASNQANCSCSRPSRTAHWSPDRAVHLRRGRPGPSRCVSPAIHSACRQRAPPGALGLLTRLPAEHLKQPAPGSQVVEDNRLATAGRELRSFPCLFRHDRGAGRSSRWHRPRSKPGPTSVGVCPAHLLG